MGIKRKAELRNKAIIERRFIKIGACLSLTFIIAIAGLAHNLANVSISVGLKEWLVLQINTPGLNDFSTGQKQASVITEVLAGQPVEVKALLSVATGKMVQLKGTIYGLDQKVTGNDILIWQGEGDLNGQGSVQINQEFTFASWSGPGVKQGRLVFKRPEPTSSAPERWQAVFLLFSL
ncbi:MAG: hypothetical protein H5U07_00465 [Candidatus Aminicenantes bacterium]|nr:hypothetical protein [Candidatus Aminicenantes bacterium]